MSKLTIDQRILKLEAHEQGFFGKAVPGTSITRQLTEDGPRWSLGLGKIYSVKQWFYGKTIEEALSKAEKEYVIPDAP